jgi:hypothetical protein
MRTRDRFVCDGRVRYYDAIAPEIRATVTAEFADQLAEASLLQRLRLCLAIRREVTRRIDAAMSHESLF